MQEAKETWVQSLNRECSLEEGMSTHCSIFAWKILCTEESSGLQSWGHKDSDMTECVCACTHTHTLSIMSLLLKKTHRVSSHARGSIPRGKPQCVVVNKTVSQKSTPNQPPNQIHGYQKADSVGPLM